MALGGCCKLVGTAAGVKASSEVNDILDAEEFGTVSLDGENDVVSVDMISFEEPDSFLAIDAVDVLSLDEGNDILDDVVDIDAVGMVF
jgi:hypothetical protein